MDQHANNYVSPSFEMSRQDWDAVYGYLLACLKEANPKADLSQVYYDNTPLPWIAYDEFDVLRYYREEVPALCEMIGLPPHELRNLFNSAIVGRTEHFEPVDFKDFVSPLLTADMLDAVMNHAGYDNWRSFVAHYQGPNYQNDIRRDISTLAPHRPDSQCKSDLVRRVAPLGYAMAEISAKPVNEQPDTYIFTIKLYQDDSWAGDSDHEIKFRMQTDQPMRVINRIGNRLKDALPLGVEDALAVAKDFKQRYAVPEVAKAKLPPKRAPIVKKPVIAVKKDEVIKAPVLEEAAFNEELLIKSARSFWKERISHQNHSAIERIQNGGFTMVKQFVEKRYTGGNMTKFADWAVAYAKQSDNNYTLAQLVRDHGQPTRQVPVPNR